MRVALVAPLVSPIADPPEGGSQAVVGDLARGLVERGHEVLLYASEGSCVAGVEVRSLGVESAALRGDVYRHGERGGAGSAAMVEAYRRIYADAAGGGWDVVHSHGFDAPAVREAGRRGVAVLHTLHLPPAAAMLAAIAAARCGETAAWFVGVSRAQVMAWEARVPLDGVVANGVPVAAIPFGATAGSRVLVAGRFSAEKGIAEGIAAGRRAGCGVDVYAGAYDDAYEREVRRRWADDGDVVFHGHASRRALWSALSRARAALCLSRWDEPFGMVAAEAAAAGTPVVATRRGGLGEIVRDGVTGFLVEEDDEDAAVAALGRVVGLERAACRRNAEVNLSLDASLEVHERLYERFALSTRFGAAAGVAR